MRMVIISLKKKKSKNRGIINNFKMINKKKNNR